jgi:hypothetical protein
MFCLRRAAGYTECVIVEKAQIHFKIYYKLSCEKEKKPMIFTYDFTRETNMQLQVRGKCEARKLLLLELEFNVYSSNKGKCGI